MADYDFSKPAPDRSHRVPIGDQGSSAGGLGLILVGAVIVLVVLYAVFGGATVPRDQSPIAEPSGAVMDTPAPAGTTDTAPMAPSE